MRIDLRRPLLRKSVAAVLAMAGTSSLQAQQQPAENIETVIVTGRAGIEEQRKVEVSYAITTINSDALRMDAPLGVADALGSVPGFWVEASGGEASANIRVRGIPQEGFSAVGLLEDGLPVQHDPGLSWLNADQAFRLDDTVERIEVVRGGPASMFASNAPGGAVNFITRKPGDEREGNLKVESSDYGLRRLDGWFATPLGDWRVGFGGFYREDDGVRDPGYTANKGGQLRFALGRSFERGSVDFNVKHIDDNVIFYLGLPLTYDSGGDVVGVPGIDEHHGTMSGPETEHALLRTASGTFPLDIGRGTDVELTQYTLQLNYDLPAEWKLSNGFRYRTSESSRIGLFPNAPVTGTARLAALRAAALASVPGATDVQLRYTTSPDTVFDLAAQNGNGLVSDSAMRQVFVPLDEWVNDLRLLRDFDVAGQQHGIAVGLYFAKVDETFQRYSANSLLDVRDRARLLDVVAVDAAGNALATITDHGITRYGSEYANGTGDSKTWALYASDEWQITDQWRVDLGARYEKVSTQGRSERSAPVNLGMPGIADDSLLSGTGVFDPFDRDYDDLGWSTGVNWQFTEQSGLFARYTSTFRLPSVGSFISSATATPVIQTMDFIEAGYKLATPGLALYVTAFNTQFDSFSFTDTVFEAGNFVQRTIFTDTETLGVEVEGTWHALDWLDVGFSGTWQDPEFGPFVQTTLVNGQPVVNDFTGNQLLRVPEVSYRVTPALKLLNDTLNVEVDYQFFGKRFSDAANTFELPKYDVLSANVRFSFGNGMSVYVRGENLLNEVGLTEGNPRSGQFISGEANSPFFIARPIFGRNFRFSFLWDF